MAKIKKINLNDEEFLRTAINYMLREYDADYDFIKANPEINKVPWYQYFWDDAESKKHFLDWLLKYVKTSVNIGFNKPQQVVDYFDLIYGLKVY